MEQAFELESLSARDDIVAPPLRALFDYWAEEQATLGRPWGDGGPPPPPAAIRLDRVGEALSTLWWCQVLDGGADFVPRFLGPKTVRAYGPEIAGASLLGAGRLPFMARSLLLLRSSVRERKPYRLFSEYSVIPNNDFRDVEGLALPLSSDGTTVDEVVGATFWHLK